MFTDEEIQGAKYKLRVFRINVDGSPPYKQDAASTSEKRTQAQRRDRLRDAASVEMREGIFGEPVSDRIALAITYRRLSGRCDAGNIIRGIADALEGIAYLSDRQVGEVHYVEERGAKKGTP